MEMANGIKVFPLAVAGTLIVFALLVWYAISRSKAEEQAPPSSPGKVPVAPGAPMGTKIAAPTAPPVEAPPPAKDPGEKILEGADRAFDTAYYETALMFYKDFELRYAGTETYDRHAIRVWERMHTSGAKMKKKDETLPAYLDARRKATDDWKRLKPLTASAPTEASKAELLKFRDSLPERDGRRAIIDAWHSPDGGKK